MTNYARINERSAFLFTDFGESLGRRWFGDETIDSLPKYTRGPKAGKPKGAITWKKVERGGWVRGEYDGGFVENRVGHIYDRKLHESDAGRFGATVGKVIRDLDREESQKKYIESLNKRIDEEIRSCIDKRSSFEDLLIGGRYESVRSILQEQISNINEDIKALSLDFRK